MEVITSNSKIFKRLQKQLKEREDEKAITPYRFLFSKLLNVPENKVNDEDIKLHLDLKTNRLHTGFYVEWLENLKKWNAVNAIVFTHNKYNLILIYTDLFWSMGENIGRQSNGIHYNVDDEKLNIIDSMGDLRLNGRLKDDAYEIYYKKPGFNLG